MAKRYDGPSKYRPVSAWGYYGLSLLYLIPVIGWVFFLVFTFHGGNINRRSYTRAIWCRFLVRLIILMLIAVGAMFALHIPPAEVPARVRSAVEDVVKLIRGSIEGNTTYAPASSDRVSVEADGRTLQVHTELKQTLDKCEALVDTFIGMVDEGRTGQGDLMGLAMSNLDTGIKAVRIYQSELEGDDRTYMDAVIERAQRKLDTVDISSIDLSWVESSPLPRLLGISLS